jgi:hypothetical protein
MPGRLAILNVLDKPPFQEACVELVGVLGVSWEERLGETKNSWVSEAGKGSVDRKVCFIIRFVRPDFLLLFLGGGTTEDGW